MGVIGPSGSGKSTLLRALNRLWEPAPGAVLLDGADIRGIDVLALRRRVGMLFQLPAMFDGTVADNVRYGPQLRGKKLTEAEVKNLLSMADLDPALSSKPASELSVGQAQRVALARTLANDPEACPHVSMCTLTCFLFLAPIILHGGLADETVATSIAAGAAAGRADERAGPHLHAEHRGGDRAAEEGEGAHHGARLPQREADPAHRRPGVPRRLRRDRRGARAVRAVRRQAPHGQALLGAQQLMARPSSPFAPSKRKEYM
uniref:ABC transporter domain-containing protein n=1 Tax=Setaria italica TaxID=4555 RepID=K3XYV7_SETIT